MTFEEVEVVGSCIFSYVEDEVAWIWFGLLLVCHEANGFDDGIGRWSRSEEVREGW
jgi:hypothetical protein